jgi:hypothetical protein
MAGEWIPIDCNLGTKPEVLEVAAATHEPIEVVVGRMVRLWSWAWHVTADGTIRVPLSMLATVAGGDDQFWSAVERAGWLVCTDETITIPGWSERFGNAAKRRLSEQRRQSVRRAYAKRTHDSVTDCVLEERRGEEKREENIPASPVATSKPRSARSTAPRIAWTASDGWQGITDADRQEWREAFPGAVLEQELAKATAWLKANPTKARRSNWRRFLVGWLQRCQDKGGTDRQQTGRRPEDKPPPKRWIDEYQPATYRRPSEVVAVATSLKLKTEDT